MLPIPTCIFPLDNQDENVSQISEKEQHFIVILCSSAVLKTTSASSQMMHSSSREKLEYRT